MKVRLCHFSSQNLPMAFLCRKNKIQSLFYHDPKSLSSHTWIPPWSHFLQHSACSVCSSPTSSLAAPWTHKFCSTLWAFVIVILHGTLFSQTPGWLLWIPPGFCFNVTSSQRSYLTILSQAAPLLPLYPFTLHPSMHLSQLDILLSIPSPILEYMLHGRREYNYFIHCAVLRPVMVASL